MEQIRWTMKQSNKKSAELRKKRLSSNVTLGGSLWVSMI